MKNIIIVNSYINTIEKENVLIESLHKLKKYGNDILLISNTILSKPILELCNNYIYNKENLLLPKDRSPLKWYADSIETIHIHGNGNSLAIIKNLYLALNFAKLNNYKKFIFIEYDNIIDEFDFYKLYQIYEILNYKSAFFTTFDKNSAKNYDTKLFAGNVNFFLENIPLPHTLNLWNNTHPYSILNETLEYILPIVFEPYAENIFHTNKKLSEYFPNSIFDLFCITNDVNIVYNNDEISKPILFIIGNNSTYDIEINNENKTEFLSNGELKKFNLDISEKDCIINIKRNNKNYKNYNLNLQNILMYKDTAIRYKLLIN